MTDKFASDDSRDERRLAGLIRQAGSREQPSAAVTAAVRQAVAVEWRQVVAARARRRALTTRWSAAAAVVVAGLAVWLAAPLLQNDAPMLASLTRVSGPVQVSTGGLFAGWAPARAGGAVTRDMEVRSVAGGRVSFQLGGSSVRMDENSTVVLLAADRIALKRGAVYIDSKPGDTSASALVVETAFGNVRHLGTQYESRVTGDALRVRVREGRVLLSGAGRTAEGAAGEQVTLRSSGDLRRETVACAGGEWAWVEGLAPDYDINDRPLMEFLRWVSRETGRELSFGSAEAERLARAMVLRGSMRDMSPRQALAAVLTTTDLRSTEAGAGLRIDLKTGD